MATWESLEQRFKDLERPLRGTRLDVQWGAAGEHWRLAGLAKRDEIRRFEAIATMAGKKLLGAVSDENQHMAIFRAETNPIHRWYKALQHLGDALEDVRSATQTTADGKRAGELFLGSIPNPVATSATLCLSLAASEEEPVEEEPRPAPKIPEPEVLEAYCNRCGGRTRHDGLSKAVDERHDDRDSGIWWVETFQLLECRGCGEKRARLATYSSEDYDWEEQKMDTQESYLPPQVTRKPPDWLAAVPFEVRLLSREVYSALDTGSERLAAMGMRALLDMAIVDKVGDVGDFGTKMKAFVDGGFVSASDRSVLDAALELGNAASHRGHRPTRDQLVAALDVVETVLRALYRGDEVTRLLREGVPPRQIGGKDSGAGSPPPAK